MKTELVVAGYLIHDNKMLLIHHRKLGLWLPPGGHIDENEIPDNALKREFREELDLDIEILNQSGVETENVRNFAVPFHTNVHPVGDHEHYCLFYLCRPKNFDVKIKPDEVIDFKWFTKEELKREDIKADVRNIAFRAFEFLEKLENNQGKSGY